MKLKITLVALMIGASRLFSMAQWNPKVAYPAGLAYSTASFVINTAYSNSK